MGIAAVTHIPVLAVDAGGTHFRAAFYGVDGHPMAQAEGGPANYQSIGKESALQVFQSTLSDLTRQVGSSVRIQYAVFGIAGLDTIRDRTVLHGLSRTALDYGRIRADNVILENDALMTLMGYVGAAAGILVNSGTGSIVCGQSAAGNQLRVGGYGHRIGDDGSGFAIGSAALRHVFRARDGLEAPSLLTHHVLSALRLSSTEDLLAWTYGPDYSVSRVAGLTQGVCRLADENQDPTAQGILESAADALADAATAVIEKLALDCTGRNFQVVLSGGVLQHCHLLRRQLEHNLKVRFIQAEMETGDKEPLELAARYGLRLLTQPDV